LYGENRILNVQELAEQRKAASRQWIILNWRSWLQHHD
jgi:hypothetical protein